MKGNFEFEVTYKCNTVCKYCNRLLGVIALPDSDLTPGQTAYACQLLRETRYWPTKIKFSGGEPRMNPYLDEIVAIVKQMLDPEKCWILTNGSDELPKERVTGALWGTNPLPKQNHDPFLCSPIDAGMQDQLKIHACTIRSECGYSFDAHGFSFCPLAPLLGRLLRINPYRPVPTFDQQESICAHCPHALPEEPKQQLFAWAKEKGNYPSSTFRKALQRYKAEPFEIPRLEPPTTEIPLVIRRKIRRANRQRRTKKALPQASI